MMRPGAPIRQERPPFLDAMTEQNENKWLPFPAIPEGILRRLYDHHPLSIMERNEDEKRSARAVAAEKILRAVNDGHLSSVEGSEEFLRKRSEVEDEPYPFLSLVRRLHGDVSDFRGVQLINFGERDTSRCRVLYIHGGAYTEEILPFHLNFCARLAERIGAYVLVPLYPLAPNHIWRETYDMLTALYHQMITENPLPITLMGDSAGGGLAIAFCQYLKTLDLPQPDHLIALSPWVDICMQDHDYEPYRPLDPMLDVTGLQTIGKAWAGGLDPRDPKVSPAFGDNHGLPKTLLFTGTREILYPDICDFYEKMKKDGCQVDLVIGEGMNHVYPLYGLPESKEAIARIDKEITQEFME